MDKKRVEVVLMRTDQHWVMVMVERDEKGSLRLLKGYGQTNLSDPNPWRNSPHFSRWFGGLHVIQREALERGYSILGASMEWQDGECKFGGTILESSLLTIEQAQRLLQRKPKVKKRRGQKARY